MCGTAAKDELTGQTLLHVLCRVTHFGGKLVQGSAKGADVNARIHGAGHRSCGGRERSRRHVELLIAHGADVNVRAYAQTQ